MAREADKSAREGKPTTDDEASASPKAKETADARDPTTSASSGSAEEGEAPTRRRSRVQLSSFRSIATKS